MDMDATDLPAPAASELLRHLGQAGPLEPAALTERLQAGHPDLTLEQVERELLDRLDVHRTAGGWVSVLAVADGAVLTHVLSAEERQAGMLAADGDLDLWRRLADQGLPLAGGGMLRTRWARWRPQRPEGLEALPGGALIALTGPDSWLEAFEHEEILTLRLRDGALEMGMLAEFQVRGEELVARIKPVVGACRAAALNALCAYTKARGGEVDDEQVAEYVRPGNPGAALDIVLAELLTARPGMLDEPMPPLRMLLTAAGLEVVSGFVCVPGAPWLPDRGRRPAS
jgi:hypothetical protein